MKINIFIIAIVLSLASISLAGVPRDSAAIQKYRQRQEHFTSQAVLAWLKAGNQRFVSGKAVHGRIPRDARERVAVSAQGQRPLATILSCIDSRTAPEIVFDTSVGDLFTARVAGTVVNDDVLGSLEFAAESGSKVIVVLGHTDCGGIKGACANVQFGHITQLLERIKPSITAANLLLDSDPVLSKAVGERKVENRRYVAEISHMNAKQSRAQILQRSPILKAKVDKGEVILVSALYDVDSGKVIFDLD